MKRRAFLTGMAGILASGVAPAAIGSGVLMPVRKLWTPDADDCWILSRVKIGDTWETVMHKITPAESGAYVLVSSRFNYAAPRATPSREVMAFGPTGQLPMGLRLLRPFTSDMR